MVRGMEAKAWKVASLQPHRYVWAGKAACFLFLNGRDTQVMVGKEEGRPWYNGGRKTRNTEVCVDNRHNREKAQQGAQQ